MRRRICLGAAMVLAVAAAAALSRGAPVRGQSSTVIRDVPYYTGAGAHPTLHRLDLFLPTLADTYPVVVFLHGGAWASGDKNEVPGEVYDNIGHGLARRGVAVALANYRLTDGGPSSVVHPEHAKDAARAAAFVRAYLNARGISPLSLYLMGHEAGAHLASLVATDPRYLAEHGLEPADLAGVIGLSGIYRLTPSGSEFADVFGLDPALRADASPIVHASSEAPPHLLMYAADDAAGRATQARDMAAALVAAGVPAVAERAQDRDGQSIVRSIGSPGDLVTARIHYFATGGSLATVTPPPPPTRTPTVTATPTSTPAPVAPPAQPASGPGGRARSHASVRSASSTAGEAPWSAWLPDDPAPASAPVLVFVPDVRAATADDYRLWLEHASRGGFLVVVPALGREPDLWAEEASVGVLAALERLAESGPTFPQASGIALAGVGSGALVAAAAASDWLASGLPPPRALLLVTPRLETDQELANMRRIPRDTRTLVVTASEDVHRDRDLEAQLWSGLADIPGAWRQMVVVSSDYYGTPALIADGLLAEDVSASGGPDALDWYGTWKWLDALTSCAFGRADCQYALGDTPEQRFMGFWADGRPVREATVLFDAARPLRRVARLPSVQRNAPTGPRR